MKYFYIENFVKNQVPLAWMVTRLLMFAGALFLPLYSVSIRESTRFVFVLETAYSLFDRPSFFSVAVLALITCIFLPAIYQILLICDTLLSLASPHSHPAKFFKKCSNYYKVLRPWKMLDIFFISALIAAIKIRDIFPLQIESGGFSLMAYVYLNVYIFYHYERKSEKRGTTQKAKLVFLHGSTKTDKRKQEISWVCLITSVILFFPANFLPMLYITKITKTSSYTILEGVSDFVSSDMWFLASVIFIASFLIPIFKFCGLFYLLSGNSKSTFKTTKFKLRLYHLMELIGKWSIIDVFVTLILVTSIRMGSITSFAPGLGTVFFAGMVIFTMISTSEMNFR